MNFHTVMSDCWCIQTIWRRQKWTRVHQNNKKVPLLNTQTVLLLNYWVRERERECVQTCHMNSKWSKKYLARHQTFLESKIRGKKSDDSPIFFTVENSFRFTRFLSHTQNSPLFYQLSSEAHENGSCCWKIYNILTNFHFDTVWFLFFDFYSRFLFILTGRVLIWFYC